MPKTLFLMCGPSGAGKSTWVKRGMEVIHSIPIKYFSRDEVRFSLVKEDEDYFSHEKEVFAKWINSIQKALDGEDCYIVADATHLTERSRNKTLDALNIPEGTSIIAVDINPGIQKCLEQNELRTGRSYVPRSAIRRMCFQYEPPATNEKYHYTSILAPTKRFWS